MANGTQEITLIQNIHTSPALIYLAFTQPEGWCAWCCEQAEAEAIVGGKLHIYTEGYHAYGEFTRLEQDRIVEFTWDGDDEPPTIILVELDNLADSTQLSYKITGLGSQQAWDSIAGFLERTWGRALNNLKVVMEASGNSKNDLNIN